MTSLSRSNLTFNSDFKLMKLYDISETPLVREWIECYLIRNSCINLQIIFQQCGQSILDRNVSEFHRRISKYLHIQCCWD